MMPQGRTRGGFQSTLPARGATPGNPGRMEKRKYFNPRSPHGERHSFRHAGVWYIPISIHAPRTGSDTVAAEKHLTAAISIHAPRTGSDVSHPFLFISGDNFNPRSPHGERHLRGQAGARPLHFNPRSPHGERRARQNGGPHDLQISIHAPRTGSDRTAL
mgnify:CR=1 FL=1